MICAEIISIALISWAPIYLRQEQGGTTGYGLVEESDPELRLQLYDMWLTLYRSLRGKKGQLLDHDHDEHEC